MNRTIALIGLTRKEILRWIRIWPQTLLPPAITSTLYFAIFGKIVGSHIDMMAHMSYATFIAPGLIMMSVITNTYANVVTSFFGARFSRCIEELLVSPMPNWLIILGYMMAGVARGAVTGFIVFTVSWIFVDFHIAHIGLMFLTLLACSMLFCLAGLINGIFAQTFDDTSICTTFILTPLIYLGGVFYNIDNLPRIWKTLSKLNPIHHLIALFRYSMLGIGGIHIGHLLFFVISFIAILFLFAWQLLEKGVGIKP